MSWKVAITKGMPEWIFGVAWLKNTLYIGFWIYISLQFRRKGRVETYIPDRAKHEAWENSY